MNVSGNHPIMEKVARLLFGIENVPPKESQRMVNRTARYCAEQVDELQKAVAELCDERDAYHDDCEKLAEMNRWLVASLKQCEIEIDDYIDAEYPADAHPVFAAKNATYKRFNPARVALKEDEKK